MSKRASQPSEIEWLCGDANVDFVESGVEWIGLLPNHWSVSKLKYENPTIESGTSVNATDVTPDDSEVGVLKTGAASKGYFDPRESKTVLADEVGRVSCPVEQGSLLVNRANTPALVGTTAYVDSSPQNLFLSDKLWQVSFAAASARFIWWWSKTSVYRQQVESNCVGASDTMQNLAQEDFRALYIALPPPAEQRSIADHLDEQTAKIDALIDKQGQLIETLRERRRTVVADAVEMGIDGDSDLHDSVPDWIRFAPARWVLTPLKLLAEVQTGVTLGGTRPENAIDVPYLRVANVQTGGLDLREIKTVPVEPQDVARHLLRIGDVLMTEGGDIDKLGRGCIWSGEVEGAIHQNHVFAVRCGSRLFNRFLVYVMESPVGRVYFEITAKRSTNLASTNSTTLRNFTFALPPVDEQRRIADHLDELTGRIDALTAKTERFIALARERRAALITAAVTGQIDVRTAA